MRFKDLSEKDKQFISITHSDTSMSWDTRMQILTTKYDISERCARLWIGKLGLSKSEDVEPEEYKQAKSRLFNKESKRFIITWCQNATPVHLPFLRNIEAYASHINADIHVIYGRYKNPTSVFQDKDQDYWDESVHPYKDANRHDIHKYLSILSDIKIQPTAVNPLTGLEAISGENSCVIGHPKVDLRFLPVLEHHKPKMLLTTGAVSVRNYTDSKAGKKGEFHHTYGFVVVELKDDDKFFIRQVTAKEDGSFTDLYYNVDQGEVTDVESVEALVLGDIHYANIDPKVDSLNNEIIQRLNPKHIVLHDIFDGESISHHDLKNPIKQYTKYKEGKDLLQKEIDGTMNWLDNLVNLARPARIVVVRSNHDDFIDRWVINQDWKKDVKNAVEYMDYTKALLTGNAPKGIIPYIIDQRYGGEVLTLDRDDSFKVKDWELAVHGDIGQNGSRGSVTQFSGLNTKMITAHTHTPSRKGGVVCVGTSTKLRMGYNQGASSWCHAHAIVHEDGKVQHILIFDGEYSTFK